jgi:hypothetical protein
VAVAGREAVPERVVVAGREAVPERVVVAGREAVPERVVVAGREAVPERVVVAGREAVPERVVVAGREAVPERVVVAGREAVPERVAVEDELAGRLAALELLERPLLLRALPPRLRLSADSMSVSARLISSNSAGLSSGVSAWAVLLRPNSTPAIIKWRIMISSSIPVSVQDAPCRPPFKK